MSSHALSTTLGRRFVQPCDNRVVVPSIPVGRRAAWMVAGTMAAAGLWVASGPQGPRAVFTGVAGTPVRLMRARAAEPLEAGAPLAISQVGFLPTDAKPFTAREPYASVRVVDERTGQVVSQADTPLRRLPSGVTGTPAVWIGDVAAVTVPGRYHLLSDTGATSAPFTIARDVFETPRRLVQRVFYFQRAFTAIEAAYAAGPWVHPSDAARAPAGVEGGWHDAGDYSLYNMTTVSSLFWLLQTAIDFQPVDDATGVPESGNGQPDLLDEARWGLRWVLAAQTPAGAFRNSTCLADYAPYGRNPIERGPSYQAGEPGTLATARSVGVLAMAADVFRPLDATFADRLLVAARRGWQYLEARPDEHSDGPTCGAYRQDGDVESGRAVRRFAAAGLLLATGEPRFAEAFARTAGDPFDEPSPYRFGAYAALLHRRAPAADPHLRATLDDRLTALADRLAGDVEAHPFGWSGRYVWGSIGIGAERTGLLIGACLRDPARHPRSCRAARTSLDYLFGRNMLARAYVSGLPGVTAGRQHAFHHWLATLDATPFLFPGAVAGGPNAEPEPNDGSRPLARPRAVWGYWGDPAMPRSAATAIDGRYTDNDSWSTNELAISWQAPVLYALHFAARPPVAAAQPPN